jgi:predicted ATPase
MLMDMFYGATEGVIKHRRRFHFHEVHYVEVAWLAGKTEYMCGFARVL